MTGDSLSFSTTLDLNFDRSKPAARGSDPDNAAADT
jgi:hypothetical protein